MESAIALAVGSHPPDGLLDGLRTGWFDITKTDWRDTMAIPRGIRLWRGDHAAMYRLDLLPAVRVGRTAARRRRTGRARENELAPRGADCDRV